MELIILPDTALRYGLHNGPGGAHTSRTMMLSELQLLLAACPVPATQAEYRMAILDENCLLKQTATTRLRSLRALREAYALDPRVIVFRALRDLWETDDAARPVLALLCATARDPVLRETAGLILATPPGEPVTPQALAGAVNEGMPGRYRALVLATIGRNAASSWQQSGHLTGRLTKVRAKAVSRPAASAYALFLGYLCGERGEALFDTLWARLLDAPVHLMHDQAFAASQQGWLEYRHTGMVTEISFRHLLRAEGTDEA